MTAIFGFAVSDTFSNISFVAFISNTDYKADSQETTP